MKSNEIISEADNDTVYKNWRKEVGTDAETTRRIIDPNDPKLPKPQGRDTAGELAALNQKQISVDIVDEMIAAMDNIYDRSIVETVRKGISEIKDLRNALHEISALSDPIARQIARKALT